MPPPIKSNDMNQLISTKWIPNCC